MLRNDRPPDDTEPSPERQAELEALYDKNVTADNAPYRTVKIQTRGELRWIMQQRGWEGDWGSNTEASANFAEADFSEANLSYANLYGADLSNAHLDSVNLSCANLAFATLDEAYLENTNFQGAELMETSLLHAHLGSSDLSGAFLDNADLRGASLNDCLMDVKTSLIAIMIDRETELANIVLEWGAVDQGGLAAGSSHRR